MDIGQIEAFLAVVQEGSFTKAATYLNLTQPSLSARIQLLEGSLDGILFYRNKRPVQLTPLGAVFLDYAERGVNILGAGYEAVRSVQRGVAGCVSISCPYSIANYLLPQVVNRFGQLYPQAELSVETGHSDFSISQLLDGLSNLALAAAFPRFFGQTQTLLRLHDEMVVAATASHELTAVSAIPINQLWQYRALVIHWGSAFDAYIGSLRQMHSVTKPLVRLPLAVALPMSQQVDTVTFLPKRLTAVSNLVVLDVPDFQFDWDVILATRQGRALTVLEQSFVDMVATVWYSSQP